MHRFGVDNALMVHLPKVEWPSSAEPTRHPRRQRPVFPLMMTNAQLKAEVREIISKPEARYYHRLSCIELMARGYSNARVAKAFDHSPSTLKRWWRKYREGGAEALREAPRGRREPPARSSLSVRRLDVGSARSPIWPPPRRRHRPTCER